MTPVAPGSSAHEIFLENLDKIRCRTDRIFRWLIVGQWIFAIVIATNCSPYCWQGKSETTVVPVQSAIILGLAVSLPMFGFTWFRPGWVSTRHVVASGQMLWSALLIHLTGGRIETHFHAFGSLAFLAFYRDSRVLLTATVVAAGDRFLRGFSWPESVYGIPNPEWWRFLEHVFWMAFAGIILIAGIRISLREMRSFAQRQAYRRTNRANYQLVAQSASDGIITIDVKGNVIFVNPAAEEMFGYSEAELIGQSIQSLVPGSQEIASGLVGETKIAELHGKRKDGSEVPIEVSFGEPASNGSAHCTVFIRDITERRKVDRLKSELLSTVSHELRTPLTSLRGFVELMLHRAYPRKKQREFLTIVHKETIRLTNLINDFLDIQRIESGRLAFTLTSVQLADLATDTIGLFLGEIGENRIKCRIPRNLPRVMADVDRVRQVLANLISNAIKFSPPKGKVIIAARSDESMVIVSVSDEGMGIPDNAIPKLFTKFYRVDNRETRSVGGSGLGLALVKELIEAQKGRVWVETELGRGSKFYFSLPRESPEPSPTLELSMSGAKTLS